MPPRRRSDSAKLPNNIQPGQLPPYVYWDQTGRGRWVYQRYDRQAKRKRTLRLCSGDASLAQIIAAYEALSDERQDNLGWLARQFEASPAWADLKHTTQRDYQICARQILTTRARDGRKIAEIPLADWSPGAIRRYVDKRGGTSRSRANHELRYLRRLFAWAYERDLIERNPAQGVKTLAEQPRQRYVQEGEYLAFLRFASESGYGYVVVLAELAYLCRLRLAEVLDLRRDDMRTEGLYSARRKGSKDAVTAWSPRLRAAVTGALSLHGKISSLYLIPGKSGGRMLETSAQTAWQRLMVQWAAQGNARFTIHDLKRRGISDYDGNKLEAGGHRSSAMLKIYDVLPINAKPTR